MEPCGVPGLLGDKAIDAQKIGHAATTFSALPRPRKYQEAP